MFQHSYIPQEIQTDLGTQFVSELFHELTTFLEIKILHASLKHPQTIGVVERAHAALTRILKLNSNQTFTIWHKYLNLATFIHNTSYHTSIGCAPTVLFHGRDPTKPLDLRFYSDCIQKSAFNCDFVESLRDEMMKKFQNAKETLAKSFNRYRLYYDRKARANPLKLTHNVTFESKTDRTVGLQPKTDAKMATFVQSRKSSHRLKLPNSENRH